MRRGAIVGFGNVAVHGHLPGWLRRHDVRVVAVADSRPDREAEAAARLPGARWLPSAEALLAEVPLDFVDICTPPVSHAPLIQRALEHGLHVLCEKPLVGSLAELAAVAGLATSQGRAVQTVHNWHHAPIVRRTAELIAAGAIGQVTGVVWETLRTRPAAAAAGERENWRVDPAVAGGGVLSDHGWHVFYILQRWVGGPPTAISATLETRRHHAFAVEDTASVQVTFPTAKAEVFLTWAGEARRNWAEVTGTEGVVQLDDGTLRWQRHGTGEERGWECPPPLSDGSQHPDWFDAVAGEFVEAMASGAASGNFREASWCVAMEAAARRSARDGGRMVLLEEPV